MNERAITSQIDPEAHKSHIETAWGIINSQGEQGSTGNHDDGISFDEYTDQSSVRDRRPSFSDYGPSLGLFPHDQNSVTVGRRVHPSRVTSKATIFRDNIAGRNEYQTDVYAESDLRSPMPTRVVRRDSEGRVVYKHTFKSPKAPELITRLAGRQIERSRRIDQRRDKAA